MIDTLLSKAKLKSERGARPPAAVELTPEGALAGALPAPGQAPVFAFAALPAGALMAGIGEANLRRPGDVAAALRKALDEVSPRTRFVTLVIPDVAVRVFVLDFDTLPAKPAEALPVLRFRLRKMVPFDVEQTGLTYQVLSQKKDECRVLAVILPIAILEEYEAAVRTAGYEPGAVLPSSLAALDATESLEAVLTVNLGETALTTTIVNGQDLLLYRTLDLPEDRERRAAEIRRGVAVAVAYYEDKLGAPPRQVYYAGRGDAAAFSRWLDGGGCTVFDLAPRPATGATTQLGDASMAGVAGALTYRTAPVEVC